MIREKTEKNAERLSGWTEATIGDIAEISSGFGFPEHFQGKTSGQFPFAKVRDIADAFKNSYGRLRSAANFVDQVDLQALKARPVPAGSTAFAKIGEALRLNRRAILSVDAILDNNCMAVTPDGRVADPEFVYHFFKTIDLSPFSVATTVPSVRRGDVEGISLNLPPLHQQRRIVAKIDSLSGKSKRARDQLDHIPRLVERYKQAILAAAFRGELTREWRRSHPTVCWSVDQLSELKRLREEYISARRGSRLREDIDSAFERIGPTPPTWTRALLSDTGRLQVGYAYKSKWYRTDGVRLLRGANIAPGEITWDDEARLDRALAESYNEYRLNAGDIVIAMDRPWISSGLKVAVIGEADAGCLLVQRVARYIPSTVAENRLIWYLLNSHLFIEHALAYATGSDLPHISSNDILTTPLPLPPLAEQREIVRRVQTAISWIDRLASETTRARKLIDHLDQAVLAKAFRGELVPQDPNDEPASVLLERIRAERTAQPAGNRARARKRAI